MNTETMFSSKTDLWATPQDFYDKLNSEFHFTLDPCATPHNARAGRAPKRLGREYCFLQSAIRSGYIRMGS